MEKISGILPTPNRQRLSPSSTKNLLDHRNFDIRKDSTPMMRPVTPPLHVPRSELKATPEFFRGSMLDVRG